MSLPDIGPDCSSASRSTPAARTSRPASSRATADFRPSTASRYGLRAAAEARSDLGSALRLSVRGRFFEHEHRIIANPPKVAETGFRKRRAKDRRAANDVVRDIRLEKRHANAPPHAQAPYLGPAKFKLRTSGTDRHERNAVTRHIFRRIAAQWRRERISPRSTARFDRVRAVAAACASGFAVRKARGPAPQLHAPGMSPQEYTTMPQPPGRVTRSSSPNAASCSSAVT